MRTATFILAAVAVLLAAYFAARRVAHRDDGSTITARPRSVASEIPILIKGLNSDNFEARKAAILGLTHITGVEFGYAPNFLPMERLQYAKIYAQWWEKVKSDDKAIWYIAALGNEHCANRAALVRKLTSMRVSNVVDIARLALTERQNDRAFFIESIRTLGEFKDTESVSVLIEILTGRDRFAAAAAGDALGKIGDKRALEYLFGTLGKTDLVLQIASAVAISLIAPADAEKAFIKLLASPDLPAQARAVDGLAEFGTNKCLKLLVPLLKDNVLSKRVHFALKKITKKELPPDPEKWNKYLKEMKK